ncbi:alpha/beta fold hydrolase [Maritalea sp.]|jgi:pimeloyl-ACP methyl ester carboxylesterase|uniref:alpha/beta fold hydrolase n=1 Tax=Maritalea sp. TaxID=2003361 RepID=UPI0039E69335
MNDSISDTLERITLPLLPNKKISVGRFEISYCDLGSKDDPVIVLCHGLASSGRQFAEDAQFFVEQGFRVILPDLRGHGRSSVPDAIKGAEFSIPNMACDLIAILDDAGIDAVHHVGNSLGGILGLHLLPAHPDRFLTFTTFGTSYALATPSFSADALPRIYDFIGPEWVDKIIARSTSKRRSAQEVVHELLDDYDINVVSYVAKSVGNYDFIENARQFEKPIMMLRGGQDILVNAALMTTMSVMKNQTNFTYFDIPKGGHCANLDAQEEVRIALLGFFCMHSKSQ